MTTDARAARSWTGSPATRRCPSTSCGKVQQRATARHYAGRLAEVLGDLRLLYEARPSERRARIRLAITRLTYSGPMEPASSSTTGERFFYRSPVRNYEPSGSNSRTRTLDPAVNSPERHPTEPLLSCSIRDRRA